MDRDQVPVPAAQGELAFRGGHLGFREARDEPVSLRSLDDRQESRSDQPRPGPANHFRKPAIAVQHGTVRGQRRRAFVHGFHEQTIGRFPALQRHDLPAATAGHHQGIDFPDWMARSVSSAVFSRARSLA